MEKTISMNKTKFLQGELIEISYENATIGTYPDWLAIFVKGADFSTGATPSLQYAYTNGSGVVVFNDNLNKDDSDGRTSVDSDSDKTYNDLTKVYYNTREAILPALPIGKYYAILLADGGYTQASNIIEFAVEGIYEKMTNIADAIREKTHTTGKVNLDQMAEHARREFVKGYFSNLPIDESAVRAVVSTLEGNINTAVNLGTGGDSYVEVEKYTHLYLSRKYNWTIEPADALVGGEDLSDYIDYYWVQGDFKVTCNGIKEPRIYVNKYSTVVDENGEFRPPLLVSVWGCTQYNEWIGIFSKDTEVFNKGTLLDHWGYVQIGGREYDSVLLNPDFVPDNNTTVIVSQSNLCPEKTIALTAGEYILALCQGDPNGDDDFAVISSAAMLLR